MRLVYEEGKYRVRIVGQELVPRSNGNTELRFAVLPIGVYDGENFTNEEGPMSRTVFITLTPLTWGNSEKPRWVLKMLRTLGFKGTLPSHLAEASSEHWSAVDKEADAMCKHEEWNGRWREVWTIWTGEQGKADAVSKDDLAKLDAMVLGAHKPAPKMPVKKRPGPIAKPVEKNDKPPF